MTEHDFEKIVNSLYAQQGSKKTYGIERMQCLHPLLGNPSEGMAIIHIAGTNGKGSVGYMLETAFRANGYKTGLFISPHLMDVRERIQVNQEWIPQADFLRHYEKITKALQKCELEEELRPSFFEWMLGIGLLYFKEKGAEVILLETGLGGEFDATNIVLPKASVITGIAYDHMEILGPSLRQIARAKGGIIKPHTPVVLGPMPEEAKSELRYIAKQLEAPLYEVEKLWNKQTPYPQTNLKGDYQRKNAATATVVAHVLREVFPTDEDQWLHGLVHVQAPGRWEEILYKDALCIVLDVAHNEQGAENLSAQLSRLAAKKMGKWTMILGFTLKERMEGMLPKLLPFAEQVIAAEAWCTYRPVVDFKQLCAFVKEYNVQLKCSSLPMESFLAYLDSLLETNPGTPILVTGSMYLVGNVRKQLMGS